MDLQNRPSSESTPPPADRPSEKPAPSGWIGWSFVAGCGLAVPFGILLAYLAALPFFLGLFFFLLLGLMLGAVMFRFGINAPPPSLPAAWAMGTGVAALLILTSLWAEYRALPRSVDRVVRQSFFRSFTPQDREALRQGVRMHVADFLEQYPPGGFVGYLRWAATDGTLTCPRIFKDSTEVYQLPYRRTMWDIRVGLSFALVWWTIMTQMFALRSDTRGQSAILKEPVETAPPDGPESADESAHESRAESEADDSTPPRSAP